MTAFQIRRTFAGEHLSIVEVRGDLSGRHAAILKRWIEKLTRERVHRVRLDLRRVRQAEPAACRLLADLSRQLGSRGGDLVVTQACDSVRQQLQGVISPTAA